MSNKIEEQAELRGQVREILDTHGTFYIRATRKAILSGSDEDIAAVLNENNADQSSLERIMGILAKQKESLEKEADLRGRQDELEQFLVDEGWTSESNVDVIAVSSNPTHRRVAERLLKIHDLLAHLSSKDTNDG